jgi:cytochrome c biogenesis protein
VEFAGIERWASFQIAHDPGKELALLAALTAIGGLLLSLFIRRRRLWVKVAPGAETGTLVQIAALAKNEGADLSDDVSVLLDHIAGTRAADERSAP